MATYALRRLGDPALREPAPMLSGPGGVPPGLLPAMRALVERLNALGVAAQQMGSTARVCLMRLDGALVPAANLEIVERSEETFISAGEGCLSIMSSDGRYFRTNVRRSAWVWARWRDPETWEETVMRLEGLEAVIAQHEADHLDGRCISDGLNRQQRRMAARIAGS